MKYDRNKPLISIHIPKTAGRSLGVVLGEWFGDGYFTHYHGRRRKRPRKLPALGPCHCLHGHFPRHREMGIEHRVPGQTQFITFLRNPLDMMVSLFNYKAQRGLPTGPIDVWLPKQGCFMLDHLPAGITDQNFRQILGNFVFVGVTEAMDRSLEMLAEALGRDIPERTPHANRAVKPRYPSDRVAQEYLDRNPLELEIWQWAKERLDGQ